MIKLSCKSCGAKLELAEDIDRFSCASCGSEWIVQREGGIVFLKSVEKSIQASSESDKETEKHTETIADEVTLSRVEKENMHCPYCRASLYSEDGECPSCGNLINFKCSSCHRYVEPSWKFCHYCEKPIIKLEKLTGELVDRDSAISFSKSGTYVVSKCSPISIMQYIKNLFSGRIDRLNYFGGLAFFGILVLLIGGLSGALFSLDSPNNSSFVPSFVRILGCIGFSILYIVLILHMYSLHIRRLHDLGASGWAVLLFFLPIANLILLCWMMFGRGNETSNEYGERPEEMNFINAIFNRAYTPPVKESANVGSCSKCTYLIRKPGLFDAFRCVKCDKDIADTVRFTCSQFTQRQSRQ